MDKNKKVLAYLGIIVSVLGLVFGGGSSTNWTFDFSQDHSVNVSDDDTTTINEGDTIFGIDKDVLKDILKETACDIDPELCD